MVRGQRFQSLIFSLNDDKICLETPYLIDQLLSYRPQLLELFFNEINLLYNIIKHVLLPCPIQVNNSFLPTKKFTGSGITVACRIILICDVVFGQVYILDLGNL